MRYTPSPYIDVWLNKRSNFTQSTQSLQIIGIFKTEMCAQDVVVFGTFCLTWLLHLDRLGLLSYRRLALWHLIELPDR